MINNNLPINKNQYLKCYSHTNLTVIPYVKSRLVFAELTARIIQQNNFDVVALDLPYFMNSMGNWLETPISLFPLVSSLHIVKQDSTTVSFPFVPNDAACCAAFVVKELQKQGRSIKYWCVDDSHVIDYMYECLQQPSIHLKDDYYIFIDGLQQYFESVFAKLKEMWKELPDKQRFFLAYRANIVAWRLKTLLSKSTNVLFVCEYRLWSLVAKILENDDFLTG